MKLSNLFKSTLVASALVWGLATAQSNESSNVSAPTPPPAKKKFEPNVKVNGFAFMDLYYIAQAATNISNGAVAKLKTADQRGIINTADLGASENRFGFQARRIVLGVDGNLAETFKTRLSVIAQQPYYNTNGIVSSLADNTVISVFEAYAYWDYVA
ncbi:MAG: hypothetical protein JNM63_15200, partial [Spirochaetia bacterium]|nr:hypothetical protein [Spirochaetia bacterium]